MHTDEQILQELGVWRHYRNFHESDHIRDLRIMEAKEKSLKFKKNITKKCRRR